MKPLLYASTCSPDAALRATTWRASALILVALAAAPGAQAQDAPAPNEADAPLVLKAGEILLEGTIQTVEADGSGLSMKATSFALPSGKSAKLPAPRLKAIHIMDTTRLFVRGTPGQILKPTRLKSGWFVVAVGRDDGSGQPLPARSLAVWTSVRNGKYWLDSEPGKAPEKTPEAAPEPVVPEPVTSGPVAPGPVTAALIAPPNSTQKGAPVDAASSVLENGGFEDQDANLLPSGWAVPRGPAISIIEGDNNHYVLLRGIGDINARKISRALPLKPAWKTLKFSARVRGRGLQTGAQPWENAHVEATFQDAAGKELEVNSAIVLTQDTDWIWKSGVQAIPEGSAQVLVKAANFGLGEFGLDDLSVTPDAPPDAIELRPNFPEGTFDEVDAQGRVQAAAWSGLSAPSAQIVQQDNNHFLRLSMPAPGFVGVDCLLKIPQGARSLQVQARMRAQNLKIGTQPWENARLGLAFLDKSGAKTGGWPAALELKADTDWTPLSQKIDVPPGAAFLKLSPSLLNTSGTLDLDDIQVKVLP